MQHTNPDIHLFICDVDGTLTDGGMYYSENGDELKKFNTRDGMALQIMHEHGIRTAIITSEQRDLVLRRGQKLHVDHVVLGQRFGGKRTTAEQLCHELGITMQQVAYIGDDLNCYDILTAVGFAACPADACRKVLNIPGIHVMTRKGGDAVVRELAEYLFPDWFC